MPVYEGAYEHKIRPIPLINFSYGRFFALGISTGFHIIQSEHLNLFPLLSFYMGRKEKQSEELRGLDEIDWGLTGGGGGELIFGPFKVGAVFLHDLSGNNTGFTLNYTAAYQLPAIGRLTAGLETFATWADAYHMDSYFGISLNESIKSGYQTYEADPGFKSAGGGLNLSYGINQHWSLLGVFKYSRLLGAAADNPVTRTVGSVDQVLSLVGGLYTF